MRADKKLAAATLASLALFGAQKAVQAKAVMVPLIAVGGGWQTIVSYVNDLVSGTTVHIAYNVKPALTTGACLRTDGYVRTSQNDLTSFIVDGTAQSPAPIYADTVGGTHAPIIGATTHVGFMAVENTSGANDSSLAVEAITYNAGLRFLYAQRSIDLNHIAYGNAVAFSVGSGLLTAQTTKFMSFAPTDSRPHVYAVGVSTAISVFASPYNVPIALTKANNGQYWDRVTSQHSDTARLSDQCVTYQPVCAPASAPTAGLISNLNCQPGAMFANVGGWFNLLNDVTATAANINASLRAIVFKVESNPAYGLAVTPLHPLLYTTE